MKQALLALQSAEMFTGGSLRVAVRIAGGDIEAIQQAEPVFKRFRRRWLQLILAGHFGPDPSESIPSDLLSQGHIQGFERFLSCLMGGKAGPFSQSALLIQVVA